MSPTKLQELLNDLDIDLDKLVTWSNQTKFENHEAAHEFYNLLGLLRNDIDFFRKLLEKQQFMNCCASQTT